MRAGYDVEAMATQDCKRGLFLLGFQDECQGPAIGCNEVHLDTPVHAGETGQERDRTAHHEPASKADGR